MVLIERAMYGYERRQGGQSRGEPRASRAGNEGSMRPHRGLIYPGAAPASKSITKTVRIVIVDTDEGRTDTTEIVILIFFFVESRALSGRVRVQRDSIDVVRPTKRMSSWYVICGGGVPTGGFVCTYGWTRNAATGCSARCFFFGDLKVER